MVSSSWCFTLNNYSEEEWDTACGMPDVSYLVVGREGKDRTPHLQGFVTFTKSKRLSGVSKILRRAHWEISRAKGSQAADYCKKEGDFFELDKRAQKSAKRTDMETVRELLAEKATKREVLNRVKTLSGLKIWDWAQTGLDLTRRNWPMDFRIYWGKTGAGKTSAVRDEFGEGVYFKMTNCRFWDGYQGEEVCLIDDWTPSDSYLTIDTLLRLGDRYPMRIEWKGGSGEFCSTVLIITSNWDPKTWFPGHPNEKALFRRVTDIQEFGEPSASDSDTSSSCKM